MNEILHATFARAEDGIQAVGSLLHHGVRAEDISLILPQPDYGKEDFMVPGAPGHTYDALGTVIPDPVPPKKVASAGNRSRETILDSEEGVGLGLGLGLLTAMCVPGIGLIAGSGIIIAHLMAGGAAAGSIAGGIYGYLVDRGVSHGIARIMRHHLEGGGTTLSITVSDMRENAEIVRILKGFGGHLLLL